MTILCKQATSFFHLGPPDTHSMSIELVGYLPFSPFHHFHFKAFTAFCQPPPAACGLFAAAAAGALSPRGFRARRPFRRCRRLGGPKLSSRNPWDPKEEGKKKEKHTTYHLISVEICRYINVAVQWCKRCKKMSVLEGGSPHLQLQSQGNLQAKSGQQGGFDLITQTNQSHPPKSSSLTKKIKKMFFSVTFKR